MKTNKSTKFLFLVILAIIPMSMIQAQNVVENPSYDIQHHTIKSKRVIEHDEIPSIMSVVHSEESVAVHFEYTVKIPEEEKFCTFHISDYTGIWYSISGKYEKSNLTRAEGISIGEQRDTVFRDTTIRFTLHFNGIPANVRSIDIFESPNSTWNYANVDLTKSHVAGENKVSVFYPEQIFQTPLFLGKNPGKRFSAWVRSRLKYPTKAIHNEISGHLTMKFIINEDGSLTIQECTLEDTEMNAVSNMLRQAAYRALMETPDWTPGSIHGVPVKVRYTLPVYFKIKQ